MVSWIPHPQKLQEILRMVCQLTNMVVPVAEIAVVQQDITQNLNNFTRVPDYIAYLAHILTEMPQEDQSTRVIAGYLLENNARLILTSSPEVAQYVKAAVFRAFDDGSVMIRNAAGQDIVSFLGVLEPRNWPECLSQLVNMLDLADLDKQEAAFNVLEKACEDYPRELNVEIGGTRPLDFMIPKFLSLADHPSSKLRSHAIACLSYLVPIKCQTLFGYIDTFIACLFARSASEDTSVRRHVCRALIVLLQAHPEKLMPKMEHAAEYVLSSTLDKNVPLEACEFWLAFAEAAELAPFLQPLLGKVAPVLLDCMVYGEDDLLRLKGDAKDAAVPDKDTDIKLRHCSAKLHGFDHEVNGEEALKPRIGVCDREGTIDSNDEDDLSTEWNLRTCAATALDILAVRFSKDLLNMLLVPVQDKLSSNDWLQRESGILALGAIAKGCIEAIKPHLPALVPCILNNLNDPEPLVRSITCWTLGRYASWTTQSISDEHKQKYFIPTMEGLLRMVLDNDKRVQEAGCSAFATLEEDAGMEFVPYLEPVLRNLVLAFDKYQHKNMLILYDVVGTLADAVGRELSNPTHVEILMPPLTNCWTKFKDNNVDLLPLLECLASVANAIGHAFQPYAPPVFEKCCSIIHTSLLQYQQFQQNPGVDEPDKSFLVVALDLISGLSQGLGMQLEVLVNQSQLNLLTSLTMCLKHPQAPVRQSAYAVVGDMAMGCFTILRPFMPGIMTELILQLDPEPKVEFAHASNNAVWSVGEVALRYGRDDPEFRQWVKPLISRLIPILLRPEAESLHENTAVSMGRIGMMHPGLVAPHLPEFAHAWCQALYKIRDKEEKDSAFRGLCAMAQVNFAGIAKSLLWFCDSIVQWNQPSPELNNMFATLLQGFKQRDEAGWAAQVATFPPIIQERLATRYGV